MVEQLERLAACESRRTGERVRVSAIVRRFVRRGLLRAAKAT